MKNTKKTIAISNLHSFEGHPYKVIDNEEMEALTESIMENGIVSPIIVRPLENTDGEYEVISGHRRLYAAQKAGLLEVPALIYAIDRDAAAILLVDSNLHRERILPSEKAFAYKMKADALNHKGWRTDLTSVQVAPRLATEQIADEVGTSKDTIKRYIRLTNLIPEILQYVDDGRISFTPAVELSYLNEQEQYDLLEQIELNDCTPSLSQACRFKKMSQEQGLTPEYIAEVMSEEKANQKEKVSFKAEDIRRFFPKSYTTRDMQAAIMKLLEAEFIRKQRMRSHDER